MKWKMCLAAALLAAGLSCAQKEGGRGEAPAERKPVVVRLLGVEGYAAVAKTKEIIETTAVELGLAGDLELETVIVRDSVEAAALKFPGSPTVLVNGVDVEPGVEDTGVYGVT